MLYFCTCKKCKNSSRNNQGRYLKTKKTYKKHQNAELLKQNTSDNNYTSDNNSSSSDTNLTKSDKYNDMEIENDEENLNDEERDSSDEQIPMFEIFQNIINSSR